MPDLIIVPCEIDVKLIVVIVPEKLDHMLVIAFFLRDLPDHVRMYELIYFLDWHVHPVVS